MIDSHCHLNYLDAPQDAIERAFANGVSGMMCIGVEESRIQEVLAFAACHKNVWASVGEHPDAATGDAQWVKQHLDAQNVVAVGEMGLDYYRDPSDVQKRQQLDSFDQQLAIAEAYDLPAVIHTRSAVDDTLAALQRHPNARGVLHCFTETWAMASQAIEWGYYVSISGIVTFKNAENVREVARQIPLDRLLIETDAPYLAPVPRRGKPNEPAFVAHTAAFLAELRGIDVDTLIRQTSENFFRLFNRASLDAG